MAEDHENNYAPLVDAPMVMMMMMARKLA